MRPCPVTAGAVTSLSALIMAIHGTVGYAAWCCVASVGCYACGMRPPVPDAEENDTTPLVEPFVPNIETCDPPSMCTVCQGTQNHKRGARVIACGHTFHEPCLLAWVKERNASVSCPICRASLETIVVTKPVTATLVEETT